MLNRLEVLLAEHFNCQFSILFLIELNQDLFLIRFILFDATAATSASATIATAIPVGVAQNAVGNDEIVDFLTLKNLKHA